VSLSGKIGRVEGYYENTRFMRSLAFDRLEADYMHLRRLLIKGDLVFTNSTIGLLNLEDVIVTGKVMFADSDIDLSVDRLVVAHGGIEVRGLRVTDGRCDNAQELGAGEILIAGPALVDPCITPGE
jgi:hypothetical protein